jgi:hypothetical protein
VKDRGPSKVKSSLRAVEDFIVPDGFEDDDDVLDSSVILHPARHQSNYTAKYPSRVQEIMSSSINMRRLFEVAFLGEEYEGLDDPTSGNESESMVDYVRIIHLALKERKKLGQQGLMTL